MSWQPRQQNITNGRYKLVNGEWHKLCKGPGHDAPTYLPANTKYFYSFKKAKGKRPGQLTSKCRLCSNWAKLKTPGSESGWIESIKVSHLFLELANRIGVAETCRRTGIHKGTMTAIIAGRTKYTQKRTVRKIMLELISVKRKNEYSISAGSAWRVQRRGSAFDARYCSGCGVLISKDARTTGCAACDSRVAGYERRKDPEKLVRDRKNDKSRRNNRS